MFLFKVKRTSKLNELLYELLKDLVYKTSPEISDNPPVVKFVTNDIYRSLYLDWESLSLTPNPYIIRLEYLRSSGFNTTEKIKDADTIRVYLLESVPTYRNRMITSHGLPNLPALDKVRVFSKWRCDLIIQETKAYLDGQLRSSLVKNLPLHKTRKVVRVQQWVVDYIVDSVLEEGEIVED